MILPLFRRNPQDARIDRLYGAIVAQSRLPAFYEAYGVPDTAEGRLDMIILHAVLLLHRLNPKAGADRPAQQDEKLRALGQAVFDRFCQDMDDNLREMGVGDLAVPRQMQRIAGAFYGRLAAYQEALAAPDPSRLADALRRNIYPQDPAAEPASQRLAGYARAAVGHLGRQDVAALSVGDLTYPEPSAAEATA